MVFRKRNGTKMAEMWSSVLCSNSACFGSANSSSRNATTQAKLAKAWPAHFFPCKPQEATVGLWRWHRVPTVPWSSEKPTCSGKVFFYLHYFLLFVHTYSNRRNYSQSLTEGKNVLHPTVRPASTCGKWQLFSRSNKIVWALFLSFLVEFRNPPPQKMYTDTYSPFFWTLLGTKVL